MRLRWRLLPRMACVGAVCCLALTGCGKREKVAAVVNGEVITMTDVEARAERMQAASRGPAGLDKARLLDQMVLETILLQEAARRGLGRDPEVERLLREARRQILFGQLMETLRQESRPQISDEEVAKYYQDNRTRFSVPEALRASHILAGDEATAKKALERVKAGESFAKVAQELSLDPTKHRGGDIGFFSQGQVIPEFEEACRGLKPGEISGIVKSPLGYHVILLTEKRPASEKPLEEVKEQIRQTLENQQARRSVEALVEDLRKKSAVKMVAQFASAPPADLAVPPAFPADPGNEAPAEAEEPAQPALEPEKPAS